MIRQRVSDSAGELTDLPSWPTYGKTYALHQFYEGESFGAATCSGEFGMATAIFGLSQWLVGTLSFRNLPPSLA